MTHPIAKLLAPFVKDHPDVSVRQLAVLALLHGAKPKDRTVRSLAASMGINKPSISRAADRLALENLAVRRPDPDDKRSLFLEITKLGERALAKSAKAGGLVVETAPEATIPVKRGANKAVLGVSPIQTAAAMQASLQQATAAAATATVASEAAVL